jgi:formyl-CoA transferase
LRPGAPERLGLGYAQLRPLNNRLVYCALSAFGESGPYKDKPGFDTLGQAMSGLLSLLTDPEQPHIMGIALSDYATASAAVYGTLGALLSRARTGEGCKVETSLLQASLSLFGEAVAGYLRTNTVPDRMSRVKNSHAFAFVARDKLPLVIHCSVPEKFWLNLLKAVGRADLASDERFRDRDARRAHYAELEAELARVFATRNRGEWLEILEKHDVPAGALYDVAEVLADEQVKHLRLVEEVAHKTLGKMKFVGAPVTFTDLAHEQDTAPPILGQHTESVLLELGYSVGEVHELADQGIVKLGSSEVPS